MADQNDDPAAKPPDFRVTVEQSVAGFFDADKYLQIGARLQKILIAALAAVVDIVLKTGATIGGTLATAIAEGEDRNQEAFGELAQVAIYDMFGVQATPGSLNNRGARAGRTQTANAIGDMLLRAFSGQATSGGGGSIEPSEEPAKAFLSAMAQMALEGWLEGWIVEACTLGQLETFGDLDDTISHVLGLGRASASVHGPLVKHLIVDPLEWHVNKQYRPNLLSAADAIRQMLRGRWTIDQAREELARQGWSDERFDALANAQQKFFAPADVRTFTTREHWTLDRGIQHLRDQGYDEDTATDALRLEGLHRIESLETQEASAILSAYASADIDRADFTSLLEAHIGTAPERALLTELGDLRRGLNIKHLSSSDAEAAVKAEILAVADYRSALRREGYDEDSVMTKELLLRWTLDKQTAIEEHRQRAEADRAAEQVAKAAATAAKQHQVEADAALARRGSPSDLARAVVRGLVPIARYQEVLSARYDADTVDVLTGLVEADRAAYLAQQQKAIDTTKQAAARGISTSELKAAVLEHVLTIDEYRGRLAALGFPAGDVDLLTSTLAAQLADQDAAAKLRANAGEAAKAKSIDLGRFEALVRKGHRTVDEYDALLASLGYDDASRAAMDELLEIKIADDQAAADARAAADAKKAPGALTIDQFRRAVLLGLKTEAEFDTFLTSQPISVDAHALLVAELHDDVAQASAARLQRDQQEPRSDARELPLSTVRQAARLGVIAPATYQQRLARAGYSDDDIAIEMDLLVLEIADVQAARQQRDQVEAAAAAKGLSLADVGQAVKAGVSTLEQYRSRAVELGLDAEAADTLTRVLADEATETKAATARRAEISSALDGRKVSLAVLEQHVADGTLTMAAYVAQLQQLGITLEDADLLATLLSDALAAAAPAPDGSLV